jgi:hypothetical protein
MGLVMSLISARAADSYEGKYYRGRGDVRYLELLDSARRMFAPDPEYQNLSMLYEPKWDGLVEGPTWNAWWIQNSYGTTYSALPFLLEPYLTFLGNSHDLWFDQMGDGKREGCPSEPKHSWTAPDGSLCDAARPGCVIYKQGDGRTAIHDWGFGFTAAGLLMQCEMLLISRDGAAIARYLPKLERAADFVESRRDPANNLFLVGPAANLLAPSYAGWRKPDGSYDRAYLAEISITYIAALDRLVELERLAGNSRKAQHYAGRREAARQGLPGVTARDGYFVKSVDPDGTRHGVYGAPRHGYFEATPNHDAIAFRVVDDTQAMKIYDTIASIPGLRPHDFILPNYPTLDDMYEDARGLWRFGHWVNGGHWSTCEARMILAYYRLGKYADAGRSMERLLGFARRFRLDNPLTNFGSEVYQPKLPLNITYDAFGPPAAFIRGLFEYLYRADSLTLLPHIPDGIDEIEQLFPIRFGDRQLYLSVRGTGLIRGVRLNGKAWRDFDGVSVRLAYGSVPRFARVEILRGRAKPGPSKPAPELLAPTHASLAREAAAAAAERRRLMAEGKLTPLPEPAQAAADKLYADTARRLAAGCKGPGCPEPTP